ncbi:MAG: MarR family transcriptional regulator [Desulfitobacteriaceae bacterium]|nr:MarR family transcriptional regulator [Desulfitobacteriaceae bacterium]MDD4751999.1 MarR family transcriptional regulator [Desulfitobacteriaceae bacterium]
MNKYIPDIYNLIQELSWRFGSRGLDGECCGDLSLVEYMALKIAWESEELSIQEIGSALNFTKSGASRIIDRLENKGYAVRKRSPVDGRVCCVVLTAKGTETVTKIMKRNTAYVEEMLKDLKPEVVKNVKSALEILVNSVRRQGFI